VVRKDGLVFLREMAAEVKNFMDFKMSAVMVSNLFKFTDNSLLSFAWLPSLPTLGSAWGGESIKASAMMKVFP
jgi:hypothetical protein